MDAFQRRRVSAADRAPPAASATRRRALAGLVAGSGSAALAACGAGSSPPGVAQQTNPVTIQYWTTWGAQFQVDGMKKVSEAFQAQDPLVTVELTSFGSNYDKIVSAVAAGTSPDVVTLAGGNVIQFARKATIQALDERVARSKVVRKEKFYPAQLEAASWNGKLYGIPAWEHGPGPFIFWNKAHFAEKGLAPDRPPATLDESRAYAEKLTRFAGAPGGPIERLGWQPLAEAGASLLDYWATAYDTTWYDARNRKLNLVQPGLVAAVEFIAAVTRWLTPQAIADFRKQYPQWNAPNGGMAQGAESMKVSGYVTAGVLANNAPDLPLGIGWAPGRAAKSYVKIGGGWTVTMPAGAPQPEAAWRYMEYLTTPIANQLILDHIGWLGYNKEVAQKLDVTKKPNLRFVLEAPAKATQVTAPVILPVDTGAVGAGLNKVIAGELGAREMLQQAQQEIQTALDEVLRSG